MSILNLLDPKIIMVFVTLLHTTMRSLIFLFFLDIQLNVKGCKNLEDSFKDYITEETLEGDNKYMAEGYGLQDAKKGVIFESFPPVLHLQLKRFEYDMMRDMMVKVYITVKYNFNV